MSSTVNGVGGGDGGQLHDLGALKVFDPLLQVRQLSQGWDGFTTALIKGGNLGRTRGRQPVATSAGPHVTFGLFNKLQIESKKRY